MNPKIILSPKNGPHAYYVVDASGNTVNYEIREALVKLAYERGDLIEFDTETKRLAESLTIWKPELRSHKLIICQ